MLNAFQSLVSVLMYMREITTKTSDNHMKLFMSSSHYLHVKYRKLNRKNRQAEGSDETNGGKKRKRNKKDDYVGSLKIDLLRIMLQGLGEDDDGEKKELKKKIKAVTLIKLKSQAFQMGFTNRWKEGRSSYIGG